MTLGISRHLFSRLSLLIFLSVGGFRVTSARISTDRPMNDYFARR